jgi:cellulose synthase (UDP-forming)
MKLLQYIQTLGRTVAQKTQNILKTVLGRDYYRQSNHSNTWQANPDLDTYLYVRGISYIWVRIRSVIGIVSLLCMIYAMVVFYNYSIWFWLVFAPFGLAFFLAQLLRYGGEAFYPGFDIFAHEQRVTDFWATNSEPLVDIFLPYCGEDYAVYETVLSSCTAIDYKSFTIYVLDDAVDKQIAALAKKHNAVYLSRPNRGEYKKSGNLRYGYEHSAGEYVLVLDADFVPATNILRHILPVIVGDSSVGILQTPQFFECTDALYKKSSIGYASGTMMEDFYKLDLPSRNIFGAAICVGTNAVYRRSAIMAAGGPPRVWGTEDVRQGLTISAAGYSVSYLPLILAIGLSPDTLTGFFRQHDRWCSGSLGIPFSSEYKNANIGTTARFMYWDNIIHYLSEGGSWIYIFHMLALLSIGQYSLSYLKYFLPFILFHEILLPLMRIGRARLGNTIAGANIAMTYLYSIPRYWFGAILPWKSAGSKQLGIDTDFQNAVYIATALYTLFIALFALFIYRSPYVTVQYNAYFIIIYCFAFIVTKLAHLIFAYRELYRGKMSQHNYANALIRASSRWRLYINRYSALAAFAVFCAVGSFSLYSYMNAGYVQDIAHSTGLIALNRTLYSAESATGIPITRLTSTIKNSRIRGSQTTDQYSYTVYSGDTLHRFLQLAIYDYQMQYRTGWNPSQRYSIEQKLTKLYGNTRELSVNKNITIQKSQIENALL